MFDDQDDDELRMMVDRGEKDTILRGEYVFLVSSLSPALSQPFEKNIATSNSTPLKKMKKYFQFKLNYVKKR